MAISPRYVCCRILEWLVDRWSSLGVEEHLEADRPLGVGHLYIGHRIYLYDGVNYSSSSDNMYVIGMDICGVSLLKKV